MLHYAIIKQTAKNYISFITCMNIYRNEIYIVQLYNEIRTGLGSSCD